MTFDEQNDLIKALNYLKIPLIDWNSKSEEQRKTEYKAKIMKELLKNHPDKSNKDGCEDITKLLTFINSHYDYSTDGLVTNSLGSASGSTDHQKMDRNDVMKKFGFAANLQPTSVVQIIRDLSYIEKRQDDANELGLYYYNAIKPSIPKIKDLKPGMVFSNMAMSFSKVGINQQQIELLGSLLSMKMTLIDHDASDLFVDAMASEDKTVIELTFKTMLAQARLGVLSKNPFRMVNLYDKSPPVSQIDKLITYFNELENHTLLNLLADSLHLKQPHEPLVISELKTLLINHINGIKEEKASPATFLMK
jgi:hypothetical protein